MTLPLTFLGVRGPPRFFCGRETDGARTGFEKTLVYLLNTQDKLLFFSHILALYNKKTVADLSIVYTYLDFNEQNRRV